MAGLSIEKRQAVSRQLSPMRSQRIPSTARTTQGLRRRVFPFAFQNVAALEAYQYRVKSSGCDVSGSRDVCAS
jgi:hypothetical protein